MTLKNRTGQITISVALVLTVLIPSTGHASWFGGGTYLPAAKSMIRATMYGFTQNCKSSYTSCTKFILSHDYPGYIIPAKSKACISVDTSYTALSTVDLASVAPDKKWTIQPPLVADENPKFVGKIQKGDTFIATINYEYDYIDGRVNKSSADVHFTILNNIAYFYFPLCSK
jgi:hypothetical protein